MVAGFTGAVRDAVGQQGMTIQSPKDTAIDHVIIMENISQGERVRQYVVEGPADGQWVKLAEGSAIGHKKIDRFDGCQVSKVRLRCLKSAGEPEIRKLAVYLAGSPPTAPTAK